MDIIESVKLAEEKAENIKKTALAEAKEIITNAEKKARDAAATAIAEAKADSERIIDKARAEAELQRSSILSAAEERCSLLKKEAEGSLEGAVEKFISLTEGK